MENFYDLRLVLRYDSKSRIQEKKKIDKLIFVKTKNLFCKTWLRECKDKPQNEFKIFSSHVSDKARISKVYKEFLKLNSKKKKLSNIKTGKRLKFFTKENIQIAYKCKMLTSLAI